MFLNCVDYVLIFLLVSFWNSGFGMLRLVLGWINVKNLCIFVFGYGRVFFGCFWLMDECKILVVFGIMG